MVSQWISDALWRGRTHLRFQSQGEVTGAWVVQARTGLELTEQLARCQPTTKRGKESDAPGADVPAPFRTENKSAWLLWVAGTMQVHNSNQDSENEASRHSGQPIVGALLAQTIRCINTTMQPLAKITSHVTELSMPLSSLVRLLQTSALTGELLERSQRPERLLLRGANRAARALVTQPSRVAPISRCSWWCRRWRKQAVGQLA